MRQVRNLRPEPLRFRDRFIGRKTEVMLLSSNGQDRALSKRRHGVSTRQQLHHAHLAPSATNRETGNRTENRGSNPRVCPKLQGERLRKSGGLGRCQWRFNSSHPDHSQLSDLIGKFIAAFKVISPALNRVRWDRALPPQPIEVLSERLCAGLQSHARGVRLAHTSPCPGSRRGLLPRDTVAELKTRVRILLGTPIGRVSFRSPKSGDVTGNGCSSQPAVATLVFRQKITEGQPAGRRHSLLRMWHREVW